MAFDRQRALAHLDGEEERLIGAKALDAADKALKDGQPVPTGFMDPHARQIADGVLGAIPGVVVRSYGGYNKAEYCRLLVFPDYYLTELIEPPIWAVEVRGDFPQGSVSHRDFLGAILATGLKRDRVGDIIVTNAGCQAVVTEEALRTLSSQLRQVQRVAVQVAEIDVEQLAVEPERVKQITTTVASLRLDAVAASGFGSSRTKMAREIKGGRLKLNWQPVTDPADQVAQGDVISMRGRGRVIVEEVRGETRKGRLALLLTRTI